MNWRCTSTGRRGVDRAALEHLVRRDQNSAGRWPLISSPMQISTSVGVVHVIFFSLCSLSQLNMGCRMQIFKSQRGGWGVDVPQYARAISPPREIDVAEMVGTNQIVSFAKAPLQRVWYRPVRGPQQGRCQMLARRRRRRGQRLRRRWCHL